MSNGENIVTRHPVISVVAVYVLTLAVMGLLPQGLQDVSPLGYLAFCAATGIVEEAVFCGAIYNLIRSISADEAEPSRRRMAEAMLATAIMFALAHTYLGHDIVTGVMKDLQAGAFSCCMVMLYVRTGHLWVPMTVHAVFDMAYFAWPYSQTLALPPYASAVSPDANQVLLAATTLFFALCAFIMFRRENGKEEAS